MRKTVPLACSCSAPVESLCCMPSGIRMCKNIPCHASAMPALSSSCCMSCGHVQLQCPGRACAALLVGMPPLRMQPQCLPGPEILLLSCGHASVRGQHVAAVGRKRRPHAGGVAATAGEACAPARRWKLVHGDVFRAPSALELLAALVGTGVQLALLVLSVILITIAGARPPAAPHMHCLSFATG